RKAWESLVKAGGFDTLGDRSVLAFNLDNIQQFASKVQKEALSGQIDLFGESLADSGAKSSIVMQEPAIATTTKDYLIWERELLGLYISSHPLDEYEVYLSEQTMPLSEV